VKAMAMARSGDFLCFQTEVRPHIVGPMRDFEPETMPLTTAARLAHMRLPFRDQFQIQFRLVQMRTQEMGKELE
jgi:hypothetical protein